MRLRFWKFSVIWGMSSFLLAFTFWMPCLWSPQAQGSWIGQTPEGSKVFLFFTLPVNNEWQHLELPLPMPQTLHRLRFKWEGWFAQGLEWKSLELYDASGKMMQKFEAHELSRWKTEGIQFQGAFGQIKSGVYQARGQSPALVSSPVTRLVWQVRARRAESWGSWLTWGINHLELWPFWGTALFFLGGALFAKAQDRPWHLD